MPSSNTYTSFAIRCARPPAPAGLNPLGTSTASTSGPAGYWRRSSSRRGRSIGRRSLSFRPSLSRFSARIAPPAGSDAAQKGGRSRRSASRTLSSCPFTRDLAHRPDEFRPMVLGERLGLGVYCWGHTSPVVAANRGTCPLQDGPRLRIRASGVEEFLHGRARSFDGDPLPLAKGDVARRLTRCRPRYEHGLIVAPATASGADRLSYDQPHRAEMHPATGLRDEGHTVLRPALRLRDPTSAAALTPTRTRDAIGRNPRTSLDVYGERVRLFFTSAPR